MNNLSGKAPQTGAPSVPTGQAPQLPSGAPASDQLLSFLLAP